MRVAPARRDAGLDLETPHRESGRRNRLPDASRAQVCQTPRGNLREWDAFITEDEIMESAHEHEVPLNAARRPKTMPMLDVAFFDT
jgi:hypothetical protein